MKVILFNETEKWKKIPKYPEYEASTLGRIRTKKRKDSFGRTRQSKILNQTLDGGYLSVGVGTLVTKDKPRKYTIERVHRLICLTFCGNPTKDKCYALHKDDNKLNNNKDNLYWGNGSDNMKDMYRNGNRDVSGENNPSATITRDIVGELRKLYIPKSRVFGRRALARRYNLSERLVKHVLEKTSWRHI